MSTHEGNNGKNNYESVKTDTGLDSEVELIPASKKISNFKYTLMLTFSICIKVLQPLTISKAKSSDGSIRFNESTMVLLIESAKLVFCLCMFVFQYSVSKSESKQELYSLTFIQSLHFLIPALLYGASNTLVYFGMSYISPALFHVFGNTRILTAGIMYRIIIGKKQTDIQWLSMIIIAIGAIMSSNTNSSGELKNAFIGFFLILAMSIFSTSASIYTEKFFKKSENVSIFYQNCLLYTFGLLVNAGALIIRSNSMDGKEVFAGFDIYAVFVLIVQSIMGISLSFIFKYLDNIVYVISLVISMFLTAIISSFTDNFEFTFTFLSSLMLVTIGIYFFYRTKIFERFHIQENLVMF